MCDTINSFRYDKYEFQSKEEELLAMKYRKILIDLMGIIFPDLKFEVVISHHSPKTKKADWYSNWFLQLNIYDVDRNPIYNPNNFDTAYRVYVSGVVISPSMIYDEIESFITELNKYIEISFFGCSGPTYYGFGFNAPFINFECWSEYFYRSNISPRYDNIFV
jgi:hypothetical protein